MTVIGNDYRQSRLFKQHLLQYYVIHQSRCAFYSIAVLLNTYKIKVFHGIFIR